VRARIILLLCIALDNTRAPAQDTGWGLAGEIGSAGFGGHSRAAGNAPESSGHPSRSTTWGFRLDRTGRTLRLSLGLLMGSAGVEFENDDLSVESKGLLSLLGVSPELSLLVLRSGSAAVRLHAGAVIDHWSPEGDESRTRMGGLGGTSVEFRLARRFHGQIRWEVALTGSVFDSDDLPPEFEPKTGVRQRWALGLRYGL
jgi:hypothetical protein